MPVTIDVPGGISTFVLGNSTIANVVVPQGQLRSRYAIVTALKPGVTNMLIWTEITPSTHQLYCASG